MKMFSTRFLVATKSRYTHTNSYNHFAQLTNAARLLGWIVGLKERQSFIADMKWKIETCISMLEGNIKVDLRLN